MPDVGREATAMVEGFCGVRPAHEPHEWRFLRCDGVPPEGRETAHAAWCAADRGAEWPSCGYACSTTWPDAGRQPTPLTKRRRKRWCYECQTFTLCHRYPTSLLEEQIDLCSRCAKEVA